eukprot:m.66637 g.66637  ORF g.66637 m.66637 type:complete len:469 (+) comp19743_c0_seq2:14-1420(+)
MPGCQLLDDFGASIGLAPDETNYMFAMIMAYPLGALFRLIPYSMPTVRHLVGGGIGLALGIFCFDLAIFHLFACGLITWLMIFVLKGQRPMIPFVFVMTYMTAMHAYRLWTDYKGWKMDVTGPHMILTQKLVNLVFCVYDGTRPEKDLLPEQLKLRLKKMPTLLELFGHVFLFTGLFAGPMHHVSHYISFIEGNNRPSKEVVKADGTKETVYEPVPWNILGVVGKVLFAFFMISFKFWPGMLGLNTEILALLEDSFIAKVSVIQIFWHLYFSSLVRRCTYYFGWIFGDGANNLAGLGFAGYNDDGSANFNLISNVNVYKVETATNLRTILSEWNIQTQKWLRYVVYDRTKSVFWTMFLSGLWHGLYPGYMMTFITAAFITEAARKVYKACPDVPGWFLPIWKIGCWMLTQFFLCYMVGPFVALDFWSSLQLWGRFYFMGHVLVAAVLILPLKPYKREHKVVDVTKKLT